MQLSNEDFGLLQLSIDAIMERIADLHLSVVIESNFDDLQGFLAANDADRNPTFNPVFSDIEQDAFWFRVVDERGTTVACHADRIFRLEDFGDLLETGRLWYRDGFGPHSPVDVRVERPHTLVGGTVSHSGSLYVHPRSRGRGLSLYLPYLSRSVLLRNFNTTYHTGVVFKSLAGSRVPTANYGYPHVDPCLDGFFPPTGKSELMYFCYIDQRESLQQLRSLPEHPEFPIDLGFGSNRKIFEYPAVGANDQRGYAAAVVGER
ncbi:MAG TPA: hypothetical protein VMU42_06805 [Candidatus Sulfotelmatobacter sp.]|nr:hypothetical protein [Candidatus Sulfotelmatobacter sp.]